MRTLELSESFKRTGKHSKAYRVKDCGTYLEFKKTSDSKRLIGANFCRERLCPMCAWRRSRKVYSQTSKVIDALQAEKEYRFIFLTLTCRNVAPDALPDALDKLFYGFNRLTKLKKVKTAIKGYFRALEVTHNLDEDSPSYDTYHPHFHCILQVEKSYFKNDYIAQAEWTSLWQNCLDADYTPIVDIRAFKSESPRTLAKSVKEAAKYTVKDNDYLVHDEAMTDSAVTVLDGALKGRRLVAYGGDMKRVHKELKLDDAMDGDLIKADSDEELNEVMEQVTEIYRWNIGYKQYVKIDRKKEMDKALEGYAKSDIIKPSKQI